MQSTTMLFVEDVEIASKWFQDFLGVTSGHGGPEFEMLLWDDNLFLQLHLIEEGHHDHEVSTEAPLGHGVILVVYVDDAERLYQRAQSLQLNLVSQLHYNEIAHMHEFVVKEPNGYALMICQAQWQQD
ncbi:MAG: VOC family protein [Pseudomonadota bacterium]